MKMLAGVLVLMFAQTLFAQMPTAGSNGHRLDGVFQRVAGQSEECNKTFVIDRASRAASNRTSVLYRSDGMAILEMYGDTFDNLGFCRLQNGGGLKWHSQSFKDCVVVDTENEFKATHQEFYAPWVVGTPSYSAVHIRLAADGKHFEILKQIGNYSQVCLYSQLDR